ncbi:MAG: porin [Acidobacteriota bacterium]
MPCRLALVAFSILAAGASVSRADDTEKITFKFQAYGTLGLVHSSENQADFVGSLLIGHGAGHTHEWSPDVDSRLGAQLTATFGPRISAVVQVVTEQGADGSYTPQMEWANIKVQPTPDFSVRFGRIVLPAFIVSEYRKVGYAVPWVRPPTELYSVIPITTNDGMDASYRVAAGNFSSTIQANYGQANVKFPLGTAKARESWGLTNTIERGAASAHFTYQRTKLSVDTINTLFDAFRQFGPQGVAIAEKFDTDGRPDTFIGVGVAYDVKDWFVNAEWGASNTRSVVGDRRAWYVTGGYRIATVTPYLTYSTIASDPKVSDPGLTVALYPPALAGAIAALNAGLNQSLASKPVQSTISLGMRWDFRKNFDFKLQCAHSRVGRGSRGTLTNTQPGFKTGGSYNLVSAAVDFVF